jgi:hypothetical protein
LVRRIEQKTPERLPSLSTKNLLKIWHAQGANAKIFVNGVLRAAFNDIAAMSADALLML